MKQKRVSFFKRCLIIGIILMVSVSSGALLSKLLIPDVSDEGRQSSPLSTVAEKQAYSQGLLEGMGIETIDFLCQTKTAIYQPLLLTDRHDSPRLWVATFPKGATISPEGGWTDILDTDAYLKSVDKEKAMFTWETNNKLGKVELTMDCPNKTCVVEINPQTKGEQEEKGNLMRGFIDY